ncbi:tetratricopeptide repeat protein [Massilia sp. R2A-15]|uniref:tetratricopeptide repeat protein n=1 Tax=Massilia sp. R2A-15 TaxID=3064278 RepID=UPI002737023C|nr:tetratricopeptide repeat protein [Massilia sp. R2A-15]WLI87611.1 tetratricopeptide repeat protein [Massilia sp. R2A-15]
MEINRITLPPIPAPGDVTTFYSFESGTARSSALANMAVLLAGGNNATVPVLMIDWDTESPGLHHAFGAGGDGPGLLEYFAALKEHLEMLVRSQAECARDDERLARAVLEAVDWEPFVARVDQSRPLYLMRAGRFDGSYGERAGAMDWDGLFAACPALFRCFGEHMARRFRHVMVDARSGRSAAVSICTTLLPRKLVALFTPNQRSLEGMCGVVNRAIEYRCSHEDEQRPLLVYPVPCSIDSADCERRLQWRRGDAVKGGGYQRALEKLLREAYGVSRISLDSYLDEVQLQQTNAMASGETLAECAGREGDRFSLARTFETLLDWVADGHFPWQSHAEVGLLGRVGVARALSADGISTAVSVPLAGDLRRLGELYRRQGRERQAQECFKESTDLRERLLGPDHADTRASRASLAGLLRQTGKLHEAKFLYELLEQDCLRLLGAGHPETLAVRGELAATLADLNDFAAALELHEELGAAWERRFGPDHAMTLASLDAQAGTLARAGKLTLARMKYERVLIGRERLLGAEHDDTLRCTQQLALVLRRLGDLANGRKLQEGVVRARERHAGADHPDTLQALEALADILADQCDVKGVQEVDAALARSYRRRFGVEPPQAASVERRLAARLGQQDESGPACAQGGGPRPQAALSAGPHEAESVPAAMRQPFRELRGADPDSLELRLAELEHLIDNQRDAEARELADSLGKIVLRPSVAPHLRRRGGALIRQVYDMQGDKDARIAYGEAEVASLEGALMEAKGG